jgi:hypothetical protein
MNAHRFDQLAKTCGAVGSRRSVIGGLLGGALGLSRIGATGANHRPRHHCTPSDQHPCDACLALKDVCGTSEECCQDGLGPISCGAASDVETAKVCGDAGTSQCCRPGDGSCISDCDCCGALRCCDFRCINDNCDGED